MSQAQGFDALNNARLLAVDGFLGLENIRDRLLNLEDYLAHAVVVIDFRLLHAGFGGFHISVGEESVPNGPGAGDAKKPTINHVGEVAGQHVALVCLNGLGIDLREVSGEFFIHSRGFAEDDLSLGLEIRVAGHSGADRIIGIKIARVVIEFANHIERHLGRKAGRVVFSKQPDKAIHGNAVVVFRLDERRLGVGEGDLGLEDIEAGNGAGLVAVLLVLELLGEEVDGLLVRDDQGAVEDDFVEIGFHLEDNSVDDSAQAVVGFDFIGNRGANARDHSAAVVDEL